MNLDPTSWALPLQRGSRGVAVQELQAFLRLSGYDLGPYGERRDGVDGEFGGATANAVLAMRSRYGLPKSSAVDWPFIERMIGRDFLEVKAKPDVVLGEIELVQARNYTVGRYGKAVTHIVIHSMEAPEASTTAEAVARWFAGPNAPKASAHYCIDDDSIVQCVRDDDIGWHAPGLNSRSIGLEHAGYARQTTAQWLDAFSRRMLERSAKLCAVLCKRYNIPVRFVDGEALARYEPGITTHHAVSEEFEQSDHWDPGPNFPMGFYLDLVKQAMK